MNGNSWIRMDAGDQVVIALKDFAKGERLDLEVAGYGADSEVGGDADGSSEGSTIGKRILQDLSSYLQRYTITIQ